jgi:tetratricopeptide (TPR) repeat protein
VEHYTRAISLDPKKTVYFSNRAVALNSLGEHERAELDCRYILSRDSKNGKAFYQRALARGGMGRWREAEADLKDCFRFQPGNESAKKLMAVVKGEIAKLPKLSAKDVTDF